jgi:hypothetical protein
MIFGRNLAFEKLARDPMADNFPKAQEKTHANGCMGQDYKLLQGEQSMTVDR